MNKWYLKIALVMGISCMAVAKDMRVTSTNKLHRLLAAFPYALVVFYNRSKAVMHDSHTKQNILDMEIMLHALSKSPLYQGADLPIIRVDISRDDLASTLEQYNVSTLPTFITFIGNEAGADRLTGFVYRSALIALVEKNLKEVMDKYLKEKAAQRARELEVARINAYNRANWWSPYWAGYWYGGYYPYWNGPYFW